jgi:hypothetical protein
VLAERLQSLHKLRWKGQQQVTIASYISLPNHTGNFCVFMILTTYFFKTTYCHNDTKLRNRNVVYLVGKMNLPKKWAFYYQGTKGEFYFIAIIKWPYETNVLLDLQGEFKDESGLQLVC